MTRDPAALDRSVAACTKAFAAHDAQLTDERANLLNAWLAVLPGNTAYNLRSMHLLNTQLRGSVAPVRPRRGAGDQSAPRPGSRWRSSRRRTARRTTSISTSRTSRHTLVLGATGSGKSFFLNFLIAHLQRYSPRTMIFDLGGQLRDAHPAFRRPGAAPGARSARRDRSIRSVCRRRRPNLQFLVQLREGADPVRRPVHDELADDRRSLRADRDAVCAGPGSAAAVHAREHPAPAPGAAAAALGAGRALCVRSSITSRTRSPSRHFQYVDFEGLDAYPQLLEPLLFYLLHRADAAMTRSRPWPTRSRSSCWMKPGGFCAIPRFGST